ncbi:uncharacterized protein LOC141679303 [Apium graveolens]|uniref:uncharacterized protein LOC141679303 n=1 Tax=Apium graveolens TaxID=4045 RepID=UPI003D78B3E9
MKNRNDDEDNEKEVEGNVPTLTKQNVIVNDNVPSENYSNIPKSNVSIRPLLNDSDFDDFFAADLVDPELFSEPENDEHVVYDKIDVGLQFLDRTDFQKHLRKYCVSNRIVCKFHRSDNIRIKAVYQNFGQQIMCPWFVYTRKIPGEPTWSIRKCDLHHTCVGDPSGKNSSANHEFLAEYLIEKMKKSHSKIIPKPNEIADEFRTSHNTLIPYHVASKARNNVLEKINGSYGESFKLVPSLCQMITKINPKSIATYTYNSEDKTFKSVTISFDAPMKAFVTISFDAPMKAFINGCRNVVGLDGCYLKGKYGECLLSTSALDGQNGLPRLDEHPVEAINFISDRQKGLREAVHKLFPTSPHRFCLGSKLHTMFWNAARAYKVKHFEAHMDSMMVENVNAFEYLMGEDSKSWCRAFFDHNSSCEHLSNNFSESFNNMITKIREDPVWEYKVAGVVAGKVYEVKIIHSSIFIVDLDKKACSCVQWQLRGFPCQHAPRTIIVPPLLIRKQGRPRKNRRKAYDETFQEKK